jgi:hypothetical protein
METVRISSSTVKVLVGNGAITFSRTPQGVRWVARESHSRHRKLWLSDSEFREALRLAKELLNQAAEEEPRLF